MKNSLIRVIDATIIILLLLGAVAGYFLGWELFGGGVYVPLMGLVGAFATLILVAFWVVLSSSRDVSLETLEVAKAQLESTKKLVQALNDQNEVAARALRQKTAPQPESA
ncbi:MAG: hypothetical protein ACOH2I_16260 [Pseudomonas sp.]